MGSGLVIPEAASPYSPRRSDPSRQSEKAPIEAHLFSDLQKSNMPPSFAEMALPRKVSLVLHPAVKATVPNWAVESVSVPPLVWDPHTTHVQAVIAGYGTPAATRARFLHREWQDDCNPAGGGPGLGTGHGRD